MIAVTKSEALFGAARNVRGITERRKILKQLYCTTYEIKRRRNQYFNREASQLNAAPLLAGSFHMSGVEMGVWDLGCQDLKLI